MRKKIRSITAKKGYADLTHPLHPLTYHYRVPTATALAWGARGCRFRWGNGGLCCSRRLSRLISRAGVPLNIISIHHGGGQPVSPPFCGGVHHVSLMLVDDDPLFAYYVFSGIEVPRAGYRSK